MAFIADKPQAQRAMPRSAGSRALLAAALGLAGLAASCGGDAAKGEQAPGARALPVKIQVAQSVTVSDTTDYVATLKSRNSTVLMPQVEGQITNIYVRSGDRVAAGRR